MFLTSLSCPGHSYFLSLVGIKGLHLLMPPMTQTTPCEQQNVDVLTSWPPCIFLTSNSCLEHSSNCTFWPPGGLCPPDTPYEPWKQSWGILRQYFHCNINLFGEIKTLRSWIFSQLSKSLVFHILFSLTFWTVPNMIINVELNWYSLNLNWRYFKHLILWSIYKLFLNIPKPVGLRKG